jgi:hypothetical protein
MYFIVRLRHIQFSQYLNFISHTAYLNALQSLLLSASFQLSFQLNTRSLVLKKFRPSK